MPTADQIRIMEDRARPRITELWWAMQPLKSVIRFMQSGAHPDDETSGMLAALAFRDGLNLSYACSTRGEGGQNDIGTEAGADLGALRTREMERACDVLGMRMYWHGETPEDPITDFGFSKSGKETLGRWGHDRTLARFVEIVRTDRPDILCPTFLDVPGQHGHHRAMTQAAFEVMKAAADPRYPSNLSVWQIGKLYLPAWSGAGHSYDDDEPPPPATLTIDGSGTDPVSGWSWLRIGQQSRVYHQTQGMGHWAAPGTHRDWPLHLAETAVEGPDTEIFAGLPRTLADLADLPGAEAIASDLLAAQDAIDAALSAFPARLEIAQAAAAALAAIRRAADACPEAARDQVLHRLDAKEVQLGHVLRLALGAEARARVGHAYLLPGQSTEVEIEVGAGDSEDSQASLDLPPALSVSGDRLMVEESAEPSDTYRAAYDPAAIPAPALVLSVTQGDVTARARLPFDREPVVLPTPQASVDPDGKLLNLAATSGPFEVTVAGRAPEGAEVGLGLPDGWTADPTDQGFRVLPPADLPEGQYRIPVLVGGEPALSVRRIDYPHIQPTARARPAELRVTALHAEVPPVRVGYIGAGRDRVGHWLAALGADVTDLTDAEIASEASLAAYDTIVIGIFAMRFRPGLVAAAPRLHRWCEAGGTLVTLYHRPWDNWDPDRTPPRRLEIGQPSLRWRLTDETAEVRVLADHPILTTPNRIGPADWDGWVKERGLYFARSWDAAYTPLLEMADPDEAPLQGALLVADIGAGRHVHTSLILHHQMQNLVPGAFRLMANLIAARGRDG